MIDINRIMLFSASHAIAEATASLLEYWTFDTDCLDSVHNKSLDDCKLAFVRFISE